MYHFFVESSQIDGDRGYITGSDVTHIKNVLRMKVGDEILISAIGEDWDYLANIESFDEDRIILNIVSENEKQRELSAKIILLQGLPKADKMEYIIQKSVELGVSEIIPVRMKRSVVRLDDAKSRKKVERWQAISEAAAKQSKRSVIPAVLEVMDFNEALNYVETSSLKLMPYEGSFGINNTREVFDNLRGRESIAVLIGPEGGFDENEVCTARSMGFLDITLGRRILRTETASLCVLSNIMIRLEEE